MIIGKENSSIKNVQNSKTENESRQSDQLLQYHTKRVFKRKKFRYGGNQLRIENNRLLNIISNIY